MRTVELLPDDDLDAAVRAVWARLAAAGLPSLGNHSHPTNRPHVTLGSAPQLPRLSVELAALPIGVRLSGVLAFGGPRAALVWAVVPSRALLDLHAAVHAALDSDPWHAPGRWTPHVSLALRTGSEERAGAVALLAGLHEISGELVSARTYDSATRATLDLA